MLFDLLYARMRKHPREKATNDRTRGRSKKRSRVCTLRKCGFYALSGIKVAEYRYDDVTERDTLIQIYYRRARALFYACTRSFGARARNAHKKLTLSRCISAIGKIRRCFCCCCRYYLLLHACTTSFQSSLIICDALYFAAPRLHNKTYTSSDADDAISRCAPRGRMQK